MSFAEQSRYARRHSYMRTLKSQLEENEEK